MQSGHFSQQWMTNFQGQSSTLGPAHVSPPLRSKTDNSWRVENDSALLDSVSPALAASLTSNGPSDVKSTMTINNSKRSLMKGVDKKTKLHNNCSPEFNEMCNIHSQYRHISVYFWGERLQFISFVILNTWRQLY